MCSPGAPDPIFTSWDFDTTIFMQRERGAPTYYTSSEFGAAFLVKLNQAIRRNSLQYRMSTKAQMMKMLFANKWNDEWNDFMKRRYHIWWEKMDKEKRYEDMKNAWAAMEHKFGKNNELHRFLKFHIETTNGVFEWSDECWELIKETTLTTY